MQNLLLKIKSLLKVTFFRIVLFLFLGVVLFSSLYSNVKPEKLNIQLFSIAEQTLRSPITIEDKESTEAKKKDAEDQVQDIYVLNKRISQNRIDLVTSIFDSAIEVNEEIVDELNAEQKESSLPESEKLKRLKMKLTNDLTKEFPDQVLADILLSSKDDLTIARDLSITAINNVMSSRIPAHDVENAKKRVEEELKYTSLDTPLKNATMQLGRYAVIQNEFYDPEATEELRKKTVENVEPVKILQGQIIVEEGQLISRDIYRQLGLVGVLDNERFIQPFVGLALLILLLLVSLYYYFYNLEEKKEMKHTHLMQFSLIFLLSILLMKAISLINVLKYTDLVYIFPAAMGAMLIRILIHENLAVLVTIITAICGSIIFNEGVSGSVHMTVGIYILCSGLAGIMFMSNNHRRSKIFMGGLFVAAINVIIIFSLAFIRNEQYGLKEIGITIMIALMSGILSAVLTIGLIPFFEAGFGILSSMSLIELSNPNHPLLKKILTEAPGTYHHSIMVANLAESACEAIGANGLLARVGCYYHDIGKTKRPKFFIENQMNIENPHDRLPPEASKNIIMSHVTDGAEMLRKHRFPKEIIDIAEQHHGTTLLKFFYYKVKQSGVEVSEQEYRYPGPKAQTKESAIVGIADSVEAAVRSMSQPTPEQIEELVRKIISDRLQDNQFNECDLTFKELEKVAISLCESLKGIFHSRIEYPEMTEEKVKHA